MSTWFMLRAAVIHLLQVLVEEGRVRHVGLANCTADQLRRAHAVHPVSAIEVEWSLCARHNEVTFLAGLQGLQGVETAEPGCCRNRHGM